MNQPDQPPSPRPRRRHWAVRLLITLLGTYVGIALVLMFFENALVYHPTPATVDWEPPASPDVRDVMLTMTGGGEIHSWWLPCPDSSGALLYLHGNAGNLSHRGPTILELRNALRLSVLIIDYPGFGKSPGVPSEEGCYRAGDAAYDWLTGEQKIDPRQVVLFGKSLGGGVATDLASRKEHRALALVKTYTTLPDVGSSIYPWLPVRLMMRNRFDSLSRIAACRRPVFVAHGTADEVIPFALGKRLYEAANEPKEFLAMPGHMHNDPFPLEFYAGLKAFLGKHPAEAQ
jgi:fermentation-respiration switch protein FrsA (DUF1100 family)